MSIEFTFANESDGSGILEIMESDAVKGNISLVYTRRPNPVTSFENESDETAIGVFKNGENIEATICGIGRTVYAGGRKKKACYITNMKRSAECRSNINWIKSFDRIYEKLHPDICICSVVKENDSVLGMLKKKRKNLPYIIKEEGYRTYLINPRIKISDPLSDTVFRKAEDNDAKTLLSFLNDCGAKKNLFPVIDSFEDTGVPGLNDFYILERGKEILAAGALWDRSSTKQYVVKKCTGVMALLRKFNALLSLLGYIRIPPNEEKANMVFLSFFLAKNDDDKYYKAFLSHILKEASVKYDIVVLGTNVHNPKRKMLDKIRCISFDTVICEIDMSGFKKTERFEYDHSDIEAECTLL